MKNFRIFSRSLFAITLVTSFGVSSLVAMDNGNGSDVKLRDIHNKEKQKLQREQKKQQAGDSEYIKQVAKNVDVEIKQAEQANQQKENKQPKALDIKPLDIIEVITLAREVKTRLAKVNQHCVNLNALLELAKKLAPGQLKIWPNNAIKIGETIKLKQDEKSILALLAQVNDFFVKDATFLVGYFGQKTITHWFGSNEQGPDYKFFEGISKGVNGALFAFYEALRGKSSDEIVATNKGIIFLEESLHKLNEFKNQETETVEGADVVERKFATTSKEFAASACAESEKQKQHLEQVFNDLLNKFVDLEEALSLCIGPRGQALSETLSVLKNRLAK